MSDIIDKVIVIAKIDYMITTITKKDRAVKQEVIDMLLDARKEIKDYVPAIMKDVDKVEV